MGGKKNVGHKYGGVKNAGIHIFGSIILGHKFCGVKKFVGQQIWVVRQFYTTILVVKFVGGAETEQSLPFMGERGPPLA